MGYALPPPSSRVCPRYKNPPHSATVGIPPATASRTARRISAFSANPAAWSSGYPPGRYRAQASPGRAASPRGLKNRRDAPASRSASNVSA